MHILSICCWLTLLTCPTDITKQKLKGCLYFFFIFYITYKNHYFIILQSVDSCFQIIFKIKFATHNKYVSHVMFLTSKLQVWKWIIKTFIYKMFPLLKILCSGRIKLVYPKVHCMLFIILQGRMMGKTQNLFFFYKCSIPFFKIGIAYMF